MKRRLARVFLVCVCFLYVMLLSMIAFYPAVLHKPVPGLSLPMAIPAAFLFLLTVFVIMVYFVRGWEE